MRTKVLIVDDHPITRAGVRAILETNRNILVIGEAVDGNDAITKVGKLKPEIVVMDITMPNISGIEATGEILKASPHVKIIALSIHTGEQFVKEMLNAGAVGYLLKDEAPEELLRAIEKVATGEMFLSSAVTRVALTKDTKQNNINTNILQTKLHRPRIMDDFIIRQKIIDELEKHILLPLSVISAAAGYGKSILVSEWLEQSTYLNTWLSLDSEHNDFRTFLLYLNAAIEKIFPASMKDTGALLLAGTLPPFNIIYTSFINEICNIEQDFILVLDDFHLLNQNKIFQFFDEWLLYPPPNVHLTIITRRDPLLNINKMRNTGRMTDIRMDDLCFTDQEIFELYKKLLRIELSDESIKLLRHTTEGWIIGLKLASMTIKEEEDVENLLKTFEEKTSSISGYLISHVLSQQPAYMMEQIIDSSILDRFNAELIQKVISINSNGKQESGNEHNLMQWLIKSNLFLVSLDSEQQWFRYHHLFHGLLQKQLQKFRSVDQIKEIDYCASKWFEKHDLMAEAIAHSLAANEIHNAIRIINDNWEATFDKDEWYIVEGWLALIPGEVADKSCQLLLARLWIEQKRHRDRDIPEIIELLEKCGDKLNDAGFGYIAFANCMSSIFKGDVKKALMFAEQALELIPKEHYIFRADTYGWWTAIMHISGQGDQAVQVAKKGLENVYPPREPIQLARRSIHPNFVYLMNANLPSVKKSINSFFKLPDNSPFILAFGWYFRGAINWWVFKQEGAISDFDNVIKYQYQCRPRIVVEAYICKALALQELKRPTEAVESIANGIQFAEASGDPLNIAVMASGSVRLSLLQKELGTAEDWLINTKHADLDVTMFWWIEISAITQCRVLISLGTHESVKQALKKLKTFEVFSNSNYNQLRVIEVLALQAQAYTIAKQESEAVEAIKKALTLAADYGFIRPFIESEKVLHGLFLSLIEENYKAKFVEMILWQSNRTVGNNLSTNSALIGGKKIHDHQEESVPFTRKEIEVLACIAEGLRNLEIADKLFNSEETIKKHISNMFQKMNVRNRLSLVSKAREMGVLKMHEKG